MNCNIIDDICTVTIAQICQKIISTTNMSACSAHSAHGVLIGKAKNYVDTILNELLPSTMIIDTFFDRNSSKKMSKHD